MENIALIAYGTWGDVLPGIRLGLILQAAGYGITLAVTEDFEARVANAGLPVEVLPIDKQRVMKLVSSQTNPWRGLWAVRKRIAPALLQAGPTLMRLSDQSDVLITNEWLLALAASAAQSKGSRLVHLSMKPRIKTRRWPIPTAPPLPAWIPLQGAYNRLTYDLARRLRWWAYVRGINSFRMDQMNLPAFSFPDYLTLLERTPSVTLVSRHVVERPPDWAPHHHQPGYLFFDDPGWHPPPDLLNFINAGPAPIYLGFGSMHDRAPGQTTRILVRAISNVRQRAVLYSGWAGLGQTDLPEHVHLLNYAPHSWLFPRMAAVVHHAGAGTAAAALRAGVPSVSIPHSGDQHFWAHRLWELGASSDPLPKSRLNSKGLTDRIFEALEDPAIKETVSSIGAKIRSEDSESRTVSVFRQILS